MAGEETSQVGKYSSYLDLVLAGQLERGLTVEERIEDDKLFGIHCLGDGRDKYVYLASPGGYGTEDYYSSYSIPCRHGIEPKVKTPEETQAELRELADLLDLRVSRFFGPDTTPDAM